MKTHVCRHCSAPLEQSFCDLGLAPLSNAYLDAEGTKRGQMFYPLHALVCSSCFLVQLDEFASPSEIFAENYAYFSSFSDTWLAHAKAFAEREIDRLALDTQSLVIELASNDGYLLKNFHRRGVPVLGVEPAANVAAAAEQAGVRSLVRFFGERLATELAEGGQQADLVVANNVLAHVPDINDFVRGIERVLKPSGVASIEFPHLLRLIEGVQFDTIYHEHFSYLSLLTVEKIFEAHGLRVIDVEELATHGGSLRVRACKNANAHEPTAGVLAVRAAERAANLDRTAGYGTFIGAVEELKNGLLSFLFDLKKQGKSIVGYGAPAKGNTLLNYCGIKPDLLPFTVDRSPHKQGLHLPGTLIPILPVDEIARARPDYVLILPWNLKDEITSQLAYIREWGAKFVTAVPRVQVWD